MGFLCPGSSLCPTSVLQHFARSPPAAPSALSPWKFGQKIQWGFYLFLFLKKKTLEGLGVFMVSLEQEEASLFVL